MKILFSYRILKCYFLCAFVIFSISACRTYYSPGVSSNLGSERLKQLREQNKYFILHCKDTVGHIHKLKVENEVVKGILYPLPDYRKAYLTTKTKGPNRIKIFEDPHILEEVHIYANNYRSLEGSRIHFPISAIEKVEIYQIDKGRTYASRTAGVIGGAMIVATPIIILIMTKAMCPYVYMEQEGDYQFCGELFGSAWHSSLERDDYLPLPDIEIGEKVCKLKISNELNQVQYINRIKLFMVENDGMDKILLDSNGIPHTCNALNPPFKAISNTGTDESLLMNDVDDLPYTFNNLQGTKHSGTTYIDVSFPFSAKLDKCKLVVRAKNSIWIDRILKEITHKSPGLVTFNHIQEKEMYKQECETENSLALKVYLLTNEKWVLQGELPAVGPLAYRELLLPIDLSSVKGNELKIRLQTGFMFWDVDYVAVDFSKDKSYICEEISVSSDLQNHTIFLENTDHHYIELNKKDDVLLLEFKIPEHMLRKNKSLFLHAEGYYLNCVKSEGKDEEIVFKKGENAIHKYSLKRYIGMVSEND